MAKDESRLNSQHKDGRFADRDAAEDVLQETFLAAYRGQSGFRGQASPETWIYRIAIHSALRVRRRRRRHRELDERATAGRSSPRQDALADPGTIEQREQARRVHEAMDHLSETHRVVLSLQALRGMSPATIATILVVPVGTVHSRAHAARKRLRELLEGSTIMNSAEDEDSAKPRATRHADDPRLQPSETTPNRASLVTPSRATGGVNRS